MQEGPLSLPNKNFHFPILASAHHRRIITQQSNFDGWGDVFIALGEINSMPIPQKTKPSKLLRRICRLLDGNKSFFAIFIIAFGLPFLLTQGTAIRDSTIVPTRPIQYEWVGKSIPFLLVEKSIDDEQDVCHPVPTDTDPSDKTSGMVLHLDTLLRKDFRLLWQSLPHPIRIVEAVGVQRLPCTHEKNSDSRTSLRPYFSDYPVFLIGDLPPPLS